MGVEIHVNTMVTGVDAQGIETNSTKPLVRRIAAATKIWAAGVEASPVGRILATASGAELDRTGRVKVERDCTLPRYPEVFVVGDLMSLDQLPGVTQVAIQSGNHAAHTIMRRLTGDTTRQPFHYKDLGTMATISRLRAVAVLGGKSVAGSAAWFVWLLVRLKTVSGLRNRLSVLFNWMVAFLGPGRAQRVIARTGGTTP